MTERQVPHAANDLNHGRAELRKQVANLHAAQDRSAATVDEKPIYGVRLRLGVVTYWNDEPIRDRATAEECRRVIEKTTGETGEIEYIFVSLPFASMTEAAK